MNEERVWYLDCLRVCAMLSVIVIHLACSTINIDGSLHIKAICLAIRNVDSFAVPIFFMISGALLLNPGKNITIKRLLKHYLLKYGCVTVIFGGGYACFERIFVNKSINIQDVLSGMQDMLYGNTWTHMWYMYALLWTLMFLPILKLIAAKFEKNEIIYICFVSILFINIGSVINGYSKQELGVTYQVNFLYCVYMLIGYWIHSNKIKISFKFAMVMTICSAILLVIVQCIDSYDLYNLEPWCERYSPLFLIYSVGIFECGRKIFEKPINKPWVNLIIKSLSKYSFAIYLIHMFWINLLFKVIDINPLRGMVVLNYILIYLIVLILSLLSAIIMKRIPLLKRLL